MILAQRRLRLLRHRVGPLSLADRLEASGKVVLNAGPPDSVAYFGWFNGAEKEYSPTQAGNFVGVKIGAPTKIGHYFLPAYATTLPKGHKFVNDGQHPPNINVERSQGPKFVPQTVPLLEAGLRPRGQRRQRSHRSDPGQRNRHPPS